MIYQTNCFYLVSVITTFEIVFCFFGTFVSSIALLVLGESFIVVIL